MEDHPVVIRRALLSVSDKTGLESFARGLVRHGVELVSTGGTARALRECGLAVREVAELTGFPEMMDGRVKTLHPMVHGGLLARRDNAGHLAAMAKHSVPSIDLLVVNLYPFEATVAAGSDTETIIENIDIGGPAMIRSAAKNHDHVTVVVDPADYGRVIEALDGAGGASGLPLRRRLAGIAYARTAAYDAAIAGWFARSAAIEDAKAARAPRITVGASLQQVLRYGENPHQTAALYRTGDARPGVASARVLQGKELSYNNIADADAAFELVAELALTNRPAVAIIKHANPCGAAVAATLAEAYRAALRTDPVSAFGGIIAVSRPLDAEAASEMVKIFTEVIIAPSVSNEARAIFAAKPNLRLLVTDELPDPRAAGDLLKPVAGGLLVQSRDNAFAGDLALKVVSKRQPTNAELADLRIAFTIAKHVRSNAIVYVKDGATAGIGAGQMSRVDSSRIAAWKAAEAAKAAGLPEPLTVASVVASDAFFPFADGLITAAEAGATAVIQPGGSVRDDEVVAAADERGLAMVFTGVRHFRH